MTKTIANADAGHVPDTSAGKSKSDPGHLLAMAICLAALAGWVDATGFIHFHKLFVSFMSGNSTKAAVAATHGDIELVELARTILIFVVGVTVGELFGAISDRWGRTIVLVLETAVLAATAVAAHIVAHLAAADAYLSVMLGFAMGLQNASLHEADGVSMALTYVTGTLVHIGRGIAGALRGAAPWHAALPFVGLWLGLVSGGFAGALTATRSPEAALIGAAAIGAALTLWSLVATLMLP